MLKLLLYVSRLIMLPWCLRGKESAYNARDVGLISGSGRSTGEGNGNPLQYSCFRNPMDRGAWQAAVHIVTRVGHNLATKQQEQKRVSYSWDRTGLVIYTLATF